MKACSNFLFSQSIHFLRAVYTCHSACCDCHPRVCNELMVVYGTRYPVMIRCSLSSILSSVKHILQDANCEAQNLTCERPFTLI